MNKDENFLCESIKNIQKNDFKQCINVLYDNIKNIKKIFEENISSNQYDDFLIKKMKSKQLLFNFLNKKSTSKIEKIYYLIIYSIIHIYKTYIDKINGNNIYVNKKINIKTELANCKKNKIYMTIFAIDVDIIKLFVLFLLLCKHKTIVSKIKNYVGIDFEFKKRNVAMMQINFEIKFIKNLNFIWIIDPYELDENMTLELINNLMINKNIYKIFQGADSRDFEYIYPHLFQNNKKLFIKFIKKVIDTRFLCEYIRACRDEIDIKSSIYYSLKYFGVITDEKYEELHVVENNMGPPQDVDWNIHKLSQDQKKYAYYDVIYLKYLVKAMYNDMRNNYPQYLNSLNYVNRISRFAFGESDNLQITSIRSEIEKIINPLNINYIKLKNENIKLNDISKIIIKDIIIELPLLKESGGILKKNKQTINLNYLFRVPYFKKCLHAVFTLIIYSNVSHIFSIYKNKKDKINEIIKYDIIFDEISKIYGKSLMSLFKGFEFEAKNKISSTYKK